MARREQILKTSYTLYEIMPEWFNDLETETLAAIAKGGAKLLLNIDKVTREDLLKIRNIGPKKADEIIALRERSQEHGSYNNH